MSGLDLEFDLAGLDHLSGWALKGNRWRPPADDVGAAAKSPSPTWAIAAAVFSGLSSAYANFAAVRTQQYQAKSQASALSFRSRMLDYDARAAEQRAQQILQQGQSDVGRISLEGSQRRAETAASTAARGVEAGVGSAAEVAASERLIEAIDVYNVNLSSVREANAARTGAVTLRNEALLGRVGSRNLRRSARAAAPEAQLLGGAAGAAVDAYRIANYRRA